MKNKILPGFEDAVKDIKDGSTIMMHSFSGAGGIAQNLILALRELGAKNLTIISCNMGSAALSARETGLKSYVIPAILLESGQISKVVGTWARAGLSPTWASGVADKVISLEQAIRDKKIECEMTSQGVLAQRIAAGAAKLGGIYSPVGIGTFLEKGKEKRLIDGREYLLEKPLRADFSFVRAYKADRLGNLVYRGTSRSYNPLLAMAADITIAEVDEIVELGELNPEHIVTPGVFVDRIVEIKR